MKLKLFSLLAVSLLPSALLSAEYTIDVYASSFDTSSSQAIERVEVTPPTLKLTPMIKLFPEHKFQEIVGVGGCFNEIGADALASLSAPKQAEVMSSLFGGDKGSQFTFCRTALGASDFGQNAYSYSEVAGDYEMKRFSIDRDKKSVIPYMVKARELNPSLKIFASPWSPPAWMKESGSMVGVRDDNTIIQSPEIFSAYAKYFVEYIKAYKANGVEINRICTQNETDMNSKYPSCIFPPKKMNDFIQNYLSPTMKSANVDCELWAGTYRVAEWFEGKLEAMELLSYPGLIDKIDGVGIQYTRSQYIDELRELYPSVKIMHTESVCFNGKNSVEQAQSRLEEVASYLNAGVENFAYWNMILDERQQSGWEWKQNSLITIDRNSGKVTYNPDYYPMALISRFVRPGDRRIAFYQSKYLPAISVVSPEGVCKVIIQNSTDAAMPYTIRMGEDDKGQTIGIPANSIAAIVVTPKK